MIPSELKQFAVAALANKGALIEEREDNNTFEVVLPPEVVCETGLPAYMDVGNSIPLAYNSPLLDHLIQWVCRDRSCLTLQATPRKLKKEELEVTVRDTFAWQNATGRVTGIEELEMSPYWVFHFFYTAKSDEVRQGLCPVVLHEWSLASPPGFLDRLTGRDLTEPRAKAGPLDKTLLASLARQVSKIVPSEIRSQLTEFLASRERRLQRDLRQIHNFYVLQESEMKKLLERRGLDDKARGVRLEKIAQLPIEEQAKETDALYKYSIRIEADCRAALRILTPALRISFELRRKKESRPLSLFWNPITKKLDPLLCEGCGENLYRIITCNAPHLLCSACSTQCPLCLP